MKSQDTNDMNVFSVSATKFFLSTKCEQFETILSSAKGQMSNCSCKKLWGPTNPCEVCQCESNFEDFWDVVDKIKI